ncbi:MAG: 4-phosphoerythronate dehydrogenase [Nannocystaceae bacterium]|nr:4-phosphoerythronate dehydrogenase [Nannocystaceae bacterium]
MIPKIVADDAIPHLGEAFAELTRVRGAQISTKHLVDAEALLVRSVTRVDAELLRGTAVRFVGSATAGVDHVDIPALTHAGVRFAHAPGCNARAVVEYILAATLGHSELRGPVGVVGAGQIGRRLTTALRRLGFEVWVCDPPRAASADSSEAFLSLPALLERCNTVSLHVPRVRYGAHETRHLIDAQGLRRLPRGALVLNTSRGDVLDNAALHEWLDADRGTAVLDVWEGEPNLRWPLLSHPRVRIATPHIAGYTAEGKARGTAMVHAALCTAFALQPSFDASAVLPPATPLARDSNAASVLRTVHALNSTDAVTRALLSRPERERPAAFEALRRNYVFRRELSAYQPTRRAPELWAALDGLS